MKRRDDYISGPHHFWIHFGFGVVIGGFVGGWISWSLFENPAGLLATAGITTLIFAYSCGRWGDSIWYWVIEHLPWLR